jgi:MFS family permease
MGKVRDVLSRPAGDRYLAGRMSSVTDEMTEREVVAPEYADEYGDPRAEVRRMATLFGAVYFAQGIYQLQTLLAQPVKYYLRQGVGYPADQIAGFFWLATLPWMIKPAYGLLSDFVPILGYRRRTYLLLANLLAGVAFCWAFGVTSPKTLLAALVLTGVGVAVSDVVVDALMVESGQRTGRVKLFQGIQWACISFAGVGSALAGGWLCDHYPPGRAFRVASVVGVVVAGAIGVLSWLLVRERRARLDLENLRLTGRGVLAAFTSVRLWLVLLYLLLAHFNPGTETPKYLHQTENLHFSQAVSGRMDAMAAAGWFVGATLFATVVAPRFSTRGGLVIGLAAFGAGPLAFLFMHDVLTASVANFLFGVGYMLGNLAMLSLAAEHCPKRTEAFTFAAMMSALNFAMKGADYTGSYLYEQVLHKQFWPLPIISAAITLVALALVPLLPHGEGAAAANDTKGHE